jgi:hypothetical protein
MLACTRIAMQDPQITPETLMSEPSRTADYDPESSAYDEGRRVGLATAALALSLVAFLNLLGLEKSILAAILAVLALRKAKPSALSVRGRATAALILAAIHFTIAVVALVVFREELLELIELLRQLG